MQSTRRRAITEKFPSLSTRNIESSENILLEIFNSHLIVEFNVAAHFRSSGCEVMTVILTIFKRSSSRAIQSRAIQSRAIQSRAIH